VAFAQATDRRVAAHRAYRVEIEADQGDARAHARGDGCRLAAGVSAADHDHVEGVHAGALTAVRDSRQSGMRRNRRCFT
jgi:hypothetical protein